MISISRVALDRADDSERCRISTKLNPVKAKMSDSPDHQSIARRYLWIVGAIGLLLAGPLSLVLFCTFAAGSFLGFFLVPLGWVMAAVAGLGIAIWAAIARQWGRAIAASALPLSLLLALLNPYKLWFFSMAAGEEIHFRLLRASYRAEIARLPTDEGPRTAVFVLSEDGWAGITNFHLVVYDESDEIGLPDDQHSSSWKARFARGWPQIAAGAGYVKSVGDHFYIVRVSF